MNKKLSSVLQLIFILFLSCIDSYSQNRTEYDLFSRSDNSSILNSPKLKNLISDAVILSINKAELQEIYENRNPEISLSIPYQNGTAIKVNLKRLDILSPDAIIIARTTNGNEGVILNDIVQSYTGNAEGFENTLVVINFTRDKVVGLMSSENDNYVLGSMKDDNGQETDNYILYKERDLKIKNKFNCGASDMMSSEAIEKMKKDIERSMDSTPTDLYIANVAIEVDFVTYNNFGNSIPNVTNYVMSLMSAVSAIYMKEVNVKLAVSYIRVWTIQDPYIALSSFAILNQFLTEWLTNQGSVPRTIAHLISTRPDDIGGVAYIDVLCDNTHGYAFSNTYGSVSILPSYSWDVFVVAHETGHNFGSHHTHNCSWIGGPIDTCWAVEGGCYTGPIFPKDGTIMSYCNQSGASVGSISFIQGFGPQPRALIRSRSESSCMTISSRPLLVGYPNGGEFFRKGNTIQIYWGTSLSSGNVNIELSLNNGSSWQTIQNNVPSGLRILNWVVPNFATTAQAKIRILNSLNTAIGDTCDGTFSINDFLNPYNITIGIEGFWNGTTQVQDTMRFYLRKNSSPYNSVDSSTIFLSSSGNAVAGFSNASAGSYYIQTKHRNGLEIWSATARSFVNFTTTNYNFTTPQSQTFGSNTILKSGRYCTYSGDVNQDRAIDLSDLQSIDNASRNFSSGYLAEDLNGDNFADLADYAVADNNAGNFVSVIKP
ncbi:MAG: M12 family metallo-peptidase [bacterium]